MEGLLTTTGGAPLIDLEGTGGPPRVLAPPLPSRLLRVTDLWPELFNELITPPPSCRPRRRRPPRRKG